FSVAALITALLILSLIGTLTALTLLFITQNPVGLNVVLLGVGVCVFLWIIAFFKRRTALCPLCRGTPLLNSGALPHSKARRLYPLSHGMTATLSIIATQRFCCMYCGSDFDLLKTPSHRRGDEAD
ncbi:MAG: hypothetical protein ACRCXD_11900, partial [Luteolibacter sp.]